MLANTIKILSDVPAAHIDPLFLIRSQAHDAPGIVLVSYGREYYDLFYYRHSILIDVGRLTPEFRLRLSLATALSTFHERRMMAETTVSLLRGDEDTLNLFRSTFYFEPSVKIRADLLPRGHFIKLLKASDYSNGLLEIDSFPPDAGPTVSLYRFSSSKSSEVCAVPPKRSSIKVLIYDVDRNREILRERLAGRFEDIDALPEKYADLVQRLESNADIISVSLLRQLPDVAKAILKKSDKEQTAHILKSISRPVSREEHSVAGPDSNADELTSMVDSVLGGDADLHKTRAARESDAERQVRELFQNAFKEFSSYLRRTSPSKAEACLQQAAGAVRKKLPEFDGSNVTFATSHMLLHVAVATVKFFKLKRNSVKERLVEILSDLYAKHFDLLEETGMTKKIEEVYRQLQ